MFRNNREIFKIFKKGPEKISVKKSICMSSTFEPKIKKVKSFSTQFFLYGENIRECPMRTYFRVMGAGSVIYLESDVRTHLVVISV